MQKTKTHTYLLRGISKHDRNWAKTIAKEKRQSVNSFLLTLLQNAVIEHKNKTV